jgi:hypothetical protein
VRLLAGSVASVDKVHGSLGCNDAVEVERIDLDALACERTPPKRVEVNARHLPIQPLSSRMLFDCIVTAKARRHHMFRAGLQPGSLRFRPAPFATARTKSKSMALLSRKADATEDTTIHNQFHKRYLNKIRCFCGIEI